MQCLINGKINTELPVSDRGLAYGHGLFETIRIHRGRLMLVDAHWMRLVDGCRRLNIPSQNLIADLERDLSAISLPDDGVCKVIVTAGSGGRGYLYDTAVAAPLRIVQISGLPNWSDLPEINGIQVRWCQLRLALQPALAGIKHLNHMEQVLARNEWCDSSIREGILEDANGYLCEGTMSNLFWIRDGVLYTPELTSSGVVGIMRNELIRLSKANGITLNVGRFMRNELEQADEVFVCNSLIGVWPVVRLEQKIWPVGTQTRRLQQLLQREYEGC